MPLRTNERFWHLATGVYLLAWLNGVVSNDVVTNPASSSALNAWVNPLSPGSEQHDVCLNLVGTGFASHIFVCGRHIVSAVRKFDGFRVSF